MVIPVRDDAEMLRSCLTALAAQTRPADEIVVVDNGSRDETTDVARDAGARVVWQPIAGIPRASATGYDAAAGDVIARLDADSMPESDWIARIADVFAADDPPDFVTGDPRFYGGNALIRWAGRRLYIGGMYAVLTPVLGHPPLFGSNMAMRAAAWRTLSGEVHREETGIHDDFDLSLHIKPWMAVVRDRELVVAVSARPFDDWASLRRRLAWVVPTVRLHWPQEAPWRRLPVRRRSRHARR